MSRLLIAGGVMVTIGALAAGSAALGRAGPGCAPADVAHAGGRDDRRRSRTGKARKPPRSRADGKSSTSPARSAGNAKAIVEPNMIVPITEGTSICPSYGTRRRSSPGRLKGWAARCRHLQREQAGTDRLQGEAGLHRGAEGSTSMSSTYSPRTSVNSVRSGCRGSIGSPATT